jgi:CRISP-associated protein Cas1
VARPACEPADTQIVVTQEADQVRVAIEDTAWIVLDTPQVTLSTALISACMDAGIAMITTDTTHTPSGVILPFHLHPFRPTSRSCKAAYRCR